MSKRVTAIAAACALVGSLGFSAAAEAQPGGYYGSGSGTYTYDPCKREQVQRGTVGAVLGGGAGAVIGSNAAARNARTEGALLGGLLGAVIGGAVGNKSAACASAPNALPPPPPPPPPSASNGYYDRGDYRRDDYDHRAQEDAYRDAYADNNAWAYGHHGERYRLASRPADPDGCTLAESPIYMPDGRVQTRFVRVCRDSSGRYAVVD